jgi:hypothetical protein
LLTHNFEENERKMGILGPKRHTQKTGDISEQASITRLLQCGYVVLQPIGQMHRYDLVIEDADGKFWKIQCKTGWLNEDRSIIRFATASSMNYTVKNKGWRNYRGQCDYSNPSGKALVIHARDESPLL